jgi:DNA-binding NarL/FixJ family response regulator
VLLTILLAENEVDMSMQSGSALSVERAPVLNAVAAPSPRTSPGVFIVSDVRLYREGLARSLARQPGITVLGATDASPAAVSQLISDAPDVIILEVAGPGSFGLAKSLSGQLPAVKIIAFAISDVEQEVLACAAAGFAGYVARDGSEADLMAAVEHALRGELFCSPRTAGVLFRHVAALSAQSAPTTGRPGLTQRECEILALLGQGLSNKEIARAMRIGGATVKNHVHRILEKLQVRRRGEAAARFRTLQHAEPPRQLSLLR